MKVKTIIKDSAITKFRISTADSTYIVDYSGTLDEDKRHYRTWVDLPKEISEAKIDLLTIYDESTLQIYL